jgi:uncharacterized protein YlxP (DUF503 family)
MSTENAKQFQISFSELDKILGLLTQLAEGVDKAAKLAVDKRAKMRQAIIKTCEMLDTVLTTVKQRISIIISEVDGKDPNVRKHIENLSSYEEWEKHYREFQMCEPLRQAAEELNRGVFQKLIGKFVFKDTSGIQNDIIEFMGNEHEAGLFVEKLLLNLSRLKNKVEADPNLVIKRLEKARGDIQVYRDLFIDLEKRVRAKL